jgi:hypothetical protein
MSRPCQCLALGIGIVPGLCPAHGRGQGAPAQAEGEAPPRQRADINGNLAQCGRSTGTKGPVAEQATPRQDATAPPRCRVRPQFTSLEVPRDP